MCSIKKNVKKISQISQENTGFKSEAYNFIKKEVLGQVISCDTSANTGRHNSVFGTLFFHVFLSSKL